jgi:hypothetical protein
MWNLSDWEFSQKFSALPEMTIFFVETVKRKML